MITFNDLWYMLEVGNEYQGVKKSCEQIWNQFSPKRQNLIYRTIAEKKSMGEFVDYNPYYAIQKNANPQPKFLDGWEQDEAHEMGIPLVIVFYNRKYLCCTKETMEAHELEFFRNVTPPVKEKKIPEEELIPYTIDYSSLFKTV